MKKAASEVLSVAGRQVSITNATKVLFPGPKHTKLDVARYYVAVSEGALRGAGGRPNMLVRYPNGIEGEFFYQKRAPQSRPDWIDVVELKFPSGRSAEELVPRDAAALATSKWWKEDRHGVFVAYNQNAKDRTIASAYSVRPTPQATVSAPLDWHEVATAEPEDFTLANMSQRFKRTGDPHAAMDKRPGSLERLLELFEKQGGGDAPWPPHYRKQAGEPARVRPSKRRKLPVVEISRAKHRADALAGFERWKKRHPEAAEHLQPADVLVDSMRGRY